MPADERPALSPGQVAVRWGVSRRTVYRLIKSGRVPAVRIGQQLRVPPEAVDLRPAAAAIARRQEE